MASSLLLKQLRRRNVEIKYLLIGSLLLGFLIALSRSGAISGLNGFVSALLRQIPNLGFAGFFTIGIIGNSSFLIQVPYTLPLLLVALSGSTLSNVLFLGLATGVGAGIGEIISYLIADRILASKPELAKNKFSKWIKKTVENHPKLTFLLIFTWGALPLPDDSIIFPLALIKYGIKRISFPLFLGKLVHNLAIAWIFFTFTELSSGYVSGEVKVDFTIGVLSTFILLILYRTEKEKINRKALAWA